MADPFSGLSSENGAQIRKYLRFFAQKKEGIVRVINNEFADAKADKLHEDVYTKDDVEDFCDFLLSATRVWRRVDPTNASSVGFLTVPSPSPSLLSE